MNHAHKNKEFTILATMIPHNFVIMHDSHDMRNEFSRYRVCLNTVYLLKTYCWKHHSKIIFKCVNSTMKLKFILKSMFWWLLWVRKQCHGIHIFLAKCTNAQMEHFSNAHIIGFQSMFFAQWWWFFATRLRCQWGFLFFGYRQDLIPSPLFEDK